MAQRAADNGLFLATSTLAQEQGRIAGSGNDRLDGGTGNNWIVGGDGIETVVYGRDVSNYKVMLGADGRVRIADMSGAGKLKALSLLCCLR
ncbi:hypothetical protein [Noviherbaspirillum sp.]|uniref:hypothetical protein n=1 Tax=Noviherbaspirillum sp. TaxID=1926288 RepID=UPI0039C9A034